MTTTRPDDWPAVMRAIRVLTAAVSVHEVADEIPRVTAGRRAAADQLHQAADGLRSQATQALATLEALAALDGGPR